MRVYNVTGAIEPQTLAAALRQRDRGIDGEAFAILNGRDGKYHVVTGPGAESLPAVAQLEAYRAGRKVTVEGVVVERGRSRNLVADVTLYLGAVLGGGMSLTFSLVQIAGGALASFDKGSLAASALMAGVAALAYAWTAASGGKTQDAVAAACVVGHTRLDDFSDEFRPAGESDGSRKAARVPLLTAG